MAGHTVILVGPTQRAFARRLIDAAPADYVVTVREPTRSTDQNALFWSLLTALSLAKPNGREHTPETWKLLAMHACNHACQFEIGLNGQPFPVGFRSSKLTRRQMSDLIDWIHAYAGEAGVSLDRDDNHAKHKAAA
jgi:hypothetical protein